MQKSFSKIKKNSEIKKILKLKSQILKKWKKQRGKQNKTRKKQTCQFPLQQLMEI